MVGSLNKRIIPLSSKIWRLAERSLQVCQIRGFFIPKREGLFLRTMVPPPKGQPCLLRAAAKAGKPRGLLWLRKLSLAPSSRASLLRVSTACTPHTVQSGGFYLGGITTRGGPRLGLHMRTWASLALGFTSALGGMGSIRLRIRGCSC